MFNPMECGLWMSGMKSFNYFNQKCENVKLGFTLEIYFIILENFHEGCYMGHTGVSLIMADVEVI